MLNESVCGVLIKLTVHFLLLLTDLAILVRMIRHGITIAKYDLLHPMEILATA